MKVKIDSVSSKFGTVTIMGKVDNIPTVATVPLSADDPFVNDESHVRKFAIQLAVAAGQGGASNQLEVSSTEEIEVSMNEIEEEKKKQESAANRVASPIPKPENISTAPPASTFKSRSSKIDEI